MAREQVWVVDDDSGIRWVLERTLVQAGYRVLERVRHAAPDTVVAMVRVVLEHIRGRKRDAANLLGWGRNTLGINA